VSILKELFVLLPNNPKIMQQSIRDIINQGKSNTADERQSHKLISLFHQADLEFELKDHLLEDLDQAKASIKSTQFFEELFERFWSKRRIKMLPARKKNHFAVRFGQWAAILVIGLIFGYYLNSVKRVSSPVYYTTVAPKGSVSEMYLPDGSHIFLNSGSKIKYSIDGIDGIREVFLTGEAWFQVVRMKEKPFLVHTSFYDVKVTGTRFNVKAYPDDKEVVTTLEEGSVHVNSPKNLKFAEEIVLKPGEQLIYNSESKNIQVGEVNTRLYTSWRENKLVFINLSLKDLRTLLERKYGVEIEIVDKSIQDYHYDGTIKNETVLEVLEILKLTLPIQYQIVGQKIVIQKKLK
jgi:transmembrane sensor